jgi:hypothetical protein
METQTKPIKPDLPRFAQETAFYQAHLKIDPQTGRKFLRLGLFSPDALTGSGKPLFRIDSRNISKIKTAIRRHRKKQRQHNVR